MKKSGNQSEQISISYERHDKSAYRLVTQHELQGLYCHVQRILQLLDYGMRGSEDLESEIMKNLKHLVGRYGLTEWEVSMLHGICSRVEKKIGK